ncbi:hypothetical protein Ancab_013358 [Ancistrocladus abbreviatus]
MHYKNACLPDALATQQFSWQAGAGSNLDKTTVRDDVNSQWSCLIEVRGGAVSFNDGRHVWGMQQKEPLGDGEK